MSLVYLFIYLILCRLILFSNFFADLFIYFCLLNETIFIYVSMYLSIYLSICLFYVSRLREFSQFRDNCHIQKGLAPGSNRPSLYLGQQVEGYPDHVINLAGFAWAKVVHSCRKAYGGLTVAVGFWTIATLFAWAFGPATVYAWKTAPVR